MPFAADLHVHSRYSLATSREISPASLWKWAQLKGISVVGTGDFTHPAWLHELRNSLEPAGNGLYRLCAGIETDAIPDACRAEVFFMPSAEISCMYRKAGRTRKVHSLILVPDFASAARINRKLANIGNLESDGRPILGLDAKTLLEIVMEESPESLFIPAHAWTPHFSVFGSESGFDSLQECFDDLTTHVRAIETGLSSDPAMNWRLSSLDGLTLLSNSDAHSPAKLGREATLFDCDLSFGAIRSAIMTRRGVAGTVEFFPEEGKYHYDGHRACRVCLSPAETIAHGYRCPACGRRLTVGVMHRVERLADRPAGFIPPDMPGFRSVIPLPEILAELLETGASGKRVGAEYLRLLSFGSEFRILMEVPVEEITQFGGSRLAEAISAMRSGKVNAAPGYDGEFGKVRLFEHGPGCRKTRRKEFAGC